MDKPCEICGGMMRRVRPNSRFCPACGAARKRENDRIRAAAQRAAEKAADYPRKRPSRTPADRRRGLTIRQIARLAAAEGLSYGQYVSKHGLH